MLISAANETEYNRVLNQTLSKVRPSISNASVRLLGTNPQGSDFDGSGAMLCIGFDGSTLVVSAKHNLEVYWNRGARPADLNEIAESFRDRIRIYYGADGMEFNTEPAQEAEINEVTPVTSVGDDPWDYDVMVLKSHNPGLAQVCSANQIYPLSNSRQKQSYDLVVNDHRLYLSRTAPLDKKSTAYFIQTGFGRVRDTVRNRLLPLNGAGDGAHGGLQYRVTSPLAAETVRVYNQLVNKEDKTVVYYPFDNAVQLTADADTSTYKGDSGGPLYLTYFEKGTGWRLFLIGVTTGGDMATAQVPCPPNDVLVANNISTSLAPCYQQGLFF